MRIAAELKAIATLFKATSHGAHSMQYPEIDSLVLTENEFQVAQTEISMRAYLKWIDAGGPTDRELEFWLEAEKEWIESCYVPDRYAQERELHQCK